MDMVKGKEIMLEKTEKMKGKVEVCLVEEGEKGKGEEQRTSVWEESINTQGK